MAHAEQPNTSGIKLEPLNGNDHNTVESKATSTQNPSNPQIDPTLSKETSKMVTIMEPTDQGIDEEKDDAVTSTYHEPEAANLEEDGEGRIPQAGTGIAKKKKKRGKPKSKRGLNAPTGFEEYYVDAPLTPAEHEEEKQIYDPTYRFTQRIETAIQRFTARRRLEPLTKDLFDRYLVLGGVDAGPKMFGGGLDTETLQTKNAAEIAELAATQYVDSDKVDAFDSAHVVDFEGCVKSFISKEIPSRWELNSEEEVKKLVRVIINFLNYLLHHDVCPEYKDQINAARAICDKAPRELWNITTMTQLLPGDFNMACSDIFGGMYQGMYTTNNAWMEGLEGMKTAGISPEFARRAFKIGIAANASDELFAKYRQQLSNKDWGVINVEETGFEITEIIRPNESVLNLYGQQQSAGLKILGKMKAKTWHSPNLPDEDLTKEEEAELKANPPALKHYEFWVEQEILENCEIGMKFEATVRETSFGLTYFDAISGVYCSFYQLIANDLMEDWREIEKEWLPMKRNKWSMVNKGHEELDDVNQEDEIQDASANQQGASAGKEDGANVTKDIQENGHQLEAETDDVPINRDLVAAGYDDDEEATKPEAKYEHNEEDADSEKAKEGDFGVEVRKAGVELKEMPPNDHTVIQEIFDVKRVEDIE